MGRWRDRRRNRRSRRDGLDCSDACDVLDCLSVLTLRSVVLAFLGLWGPATVDPYTLPPGGVAARLASRLVRAYQLHVSVPRGRAVCPMTPTCSRYALQALSGHGLWRGGWLVAGRLRRCGRAGVVVDRVPPGQ